MQDELPVLKERFRYLSKEVEEVKQDVKTYEKDMRGISKAVERLQFEMKQVNNTLVSLNTTISKDTGWRGFFIDFIKAAAQIAALVGAGKFIL